MESPQENLLLALSPPVRALALTAAAVVALPILTFMVARSRRSFHGSRWMTVGVTWIRRTLYGSRWGSVAVNITTVIVVMAAVMVGIITVPAVPLM